MNTSRLAKQYDKLTPRERLLLIMAAAGRGDQAESERLARAAPRVSWSVPDHFGLAMAFEVAEIYFMEMLDLAANYLRALATGDALSDPQAERLLDVALFFGFLFKTKLAGWRLFCREQGVDPLLCWSVLPGLGLIQRAEKVAESAAFTPKGAARFLTRDGNTEVKLLTAEAEAQDLRQTLDARAEWWG